ncbi:hypothetical protein J437_LFUL017210 [Ladona fulva]|uniref:DNA-directed DNA polymerase n=1 Tax=Ladona fulva TaxID=123851 RepID=A0A8K0PA50_LADFU|nr:hypothetical protein J437_LFUL017210 [Ladona fulva]
MLKYIKIILELISDYDMLMMVENGIRCGISQCSKRYACANNKYMKNFNSNSNSNYIMYLDANNLYEWALSQPLPQGKFEWVDNNFDFMSVPDDGPKGYILEVDMEYPNEIHDMHSNLPFCAENKTANGKHKKLLLTLTNKTKYVIHYKALKQATSYGLILKKELEDHRDLLFVKEGNKNHYCWIKNFERLVRSQIVKYKGKIEICKRCFSHFYSKEKLSDHKAYCNTRSVARIILPNESNKWIKFKNFSNVMKLPFVIYADFECILLPIETCSPSSLYSYTKFIQHHIPFSFCFHVVSSIGKKFEPFLYRGPNAVEVFLEKIREVVEMIEKIYKLNVPIKMSDEDEEKFQTALKCHICDQELGNDRVHDHCHVSGDFRGAAHATCNLNCKLPNFVPIFMHNLSGYDSHLIVPHLGYDRKRIYCIPNSEEKYISFSKYISPNFSIRFIDTFRFMSSSLSQLAQNLPKEKFEQAANIFGDKLDLVTRKGIFPYKYIDSWEKLNEDSLPSKEKFFSHLTPETVSDDDYNFANNIWKEFSCKTIGEYSDLYLKTDVVLLSDIFENFRNMCKDTYGLDPAWYVTAPGLAFDAMLKYTKINLELISDYDMLMMVENGIRGGISQCSKRYACANNKYMKNFNSNSNSNYIMYLDANNLYGWALSQPLPQGNFEWVDSNFDFMSVPDDAPKGYILEVDMEYPNEIHDMHSDLPFCAENKTPANGKHKKLLLTLTNKTKYVIHYRALKQAISHGLILKKVHKILGFDQSSWMKPYIELNSEKRKMAVNDFEKDLFKLMNNAVFGKTMENVRKRVKLELVSNPNQLEKLIAKPAFQDRTIFSKDLVHLRMESIEMNKPIYIGQAVLDMGKNLMYNFFYGKLKPKYEDRMNLFYTDTDSFILEVKTEDFYSNMLDDIHMIHQTILARIFVILFKDEAGGEIITHFIGLRSKLYSYKKQGEIEDKRAKGISKAVIDKSLSFNDYERCLMEKLNLYREMHQIRSINHEIKTVAVNKLSLSGDDDKRYILEDGINTLAWGHKDIVKKRKRITFNDDDDDDNDDDDNLSKRSK